METKAPRTLAPDMGEARWWRFSKYEIRNGMIGPGSDAELESYDLWKEYIEARNLGRDAVAPYEEMLWLGDRLPTQALIAASEAKDEPVSDCELPGDAEEQVIEWCTRFGLLGILPQQALSVTLAPRRERGRRGAKTQSHFVHTPDGWGDSVREGGGAPGALQLVPDGYSTWDNPAAFDIEHVDFDDARWSRFFPSVRRRRDSFQYPRPLSHRFWKLYAEPVSEFVKTVMTFRLVLDHLMQPRYPLGLLPWDLELAQKMFNATLMHVRPVAIGEFHDLRSGIRLRWKATTLLSAFAFMALLDATSGYQLRTCEACNRSFVSKNLRSEKYCSSRCRNTQQWRRKRAKKRQARKEAK